MIAKGHEAGGWVGEESAFVLLQRLLPRLDVPVLVQGGIGLHTAAACLVAAAGAPCSRARSCSRESPLSSASRARITSHGRQRDGVPRGVRGAAFRVHARPGLPAVDELRRLEGAIDPAAAACGSWRAAVRAHGGLGAAHYRRSARTRPLPRVSRRAWARWGNSRRVAAGDPGGCPGCPPEPPARGRVVAGRGPPHAYPIVQGPMTRVSDRAEFAAAVAEAGGLPFLPWRCCVLRRWRPCSRRARRLLGDPPSEWACSGSSLPSCVPSSSRWCAPTGRRSR